MLNIIQWKRKGPFTAVAGTAYKALLDPNPLMGRIIVTRLSATVAGTAHTMTVMQVLSKHLLTANAAAGQKVIAVPDGSVFVQNDIIGIKMPNGRYELYTVNTIDTNNVTLYENLSAAVPAKTVVAFFGVPADGHEQVALGASASHTFESGEGYFGANEPGDPIVVHVNNATAASTITAINCPVIGV